MESSGQTRAATLMNAARRSHFVSRIEKYEAKVRHAKALMKEQKVASAAIEQKRPVSNTEEPHFTPKKEQKEVVAMSEQRRPVFNTEEQQQWPIPDKMTMMPMEETVLPEHAVGQKIYRQYDKELSQMLQERGSSFPKAHQQQEKEFQPLDEREGGFGSQDEAFRHDVRVGSPEQKTLLVQKEMISGMLQRSTSTNMRMTLEGFNALDMIPSNVAINEKVLPVEIVQSDAHANIYVDMTPPPIVEVNIAAVAGALNVRVKAADMSANMQEHAFRCARECLDVVGKLQSKRIAYTLKKEFDKVYGPAWHCIVGTSFGSYVTHSLGGFVYFSLDKVSVLLFKTTVEPIENL